MSILKRIISVIIFIALFLYIGEFLRYILINDCYSFTRIMFHEFYTSKKNIDVAFVGSSHCMHSFVPSIMDKKFNSYTFNMGSASQRLDGSCIMIKELCSFNKPKYIYLELYPNIVYTKKYKDTTKMTETYVLSDYMRPSFRKIIYLLNASSKDHYVNSFILARRNWKQLLDFDYIIKNIQKKHTEFYKNYKFYYELDTLKRKDMYYVEKGYCTSYKIFFSYWNELAYGNLNAQIKMTEKNDWYKSLLDIINFCKKENIKLTFVIAPTPEWNIVGKKKYQEYHDFVQSIADKYDLDFWDFNLCKPKYFDASNLNLFKDTHHLNKFGSEQFSNIFADFINGKIAKEDLFYDTLQQKLNFEEPKIFGLARPSNYEKLKDFDAYIVSNRDKEIEYKIEVTSDKGKNRLIQDYSVNNKFKLSTKEHGKLTLSWRLISDKDKINVIVADY